MKKLLNNKKGFTLIELLAVIVILAILVMVSIPAVMKYLDTARRGTFADGASTAVSAVRNDVIVNGRQGTIYYCLKKPVSTESRTACNNATPVQPYINDLLEVKLDKSPFGNNYDVNSYIKVTVNGDETKYEICLTDGKYGIKKDSKEIDKNFVLDSVTSCTIPTT